MTTEITQQFDQFDKTLSPSMEELLSVKAAEQFRADVGDSYYASNWNWNIIASFLSDQHVPITRRNLGIAFGYLDSKGLLEKRPNDVTHRDIPLTPEEMGIKKMHSTLALRHDHEGLSVNSLLREKPERLEELAGSILAKRQAEDAENRSLAGAPGQPISKEYKTKYKQSLRVHQRSARSKMSQGEARAKVAAEFPDMDTRSQQFNALVAAELINS